MSGMSNKKKEVKFIFDNERAAHHFLSWLCGSGEQQYWEWMSYREEEEEGDITVGFDYWGGSTDYDNVEFGSGDIICKCLKRDEDDYQDDELDEEDKDEILEE